MDLYSNSRLQQFRNYVGIRFQIYNSLFTSLPFHRIEKTGVLLNLFLLHCEEGYNSFNSPSEIIDSFIKRYTSYKTEDESTALLFRFIQYAERQVVLFDALEDAAFGHVNDMQGPGTLKQLEGIASTETGAKALAEKLKSFAVRIVLTAHPTQFYPGEVLGIINDLNLALRRDDAARINMYLQQLGKTPFLRREKPTPLDEANSLIWFLEHVFYKSAGDIAYQLHRLTDKNNRMPHAVIRMGFWPGGDRDGNPFVNAGTTLSVGNALRKSLLRCYYGSVRQLKRRLTFKGVESIIAELEQLIYDHLYGKLSQKPFNTDNLLRQLESARIILVKEHNGLFLHLLDNFICRVQLFGMHFASLDLRQDSSVHEAALAALAGIKNGLPANYNTLDDDSKMKFLLDIKRKVNPQSLSEGIMRDTLLSLQAALSIQQMNGVEGCNRYIISHTASALNVIEVYGLLRLAGWQQPKMPMHIVPLFETIGDLGSAAGIMKTLYENKIYRSHLKAHHNVQTIMLGFSDGTKDGGYLMANWAILKCKQELTSLAREYGLEVIFFDGRGGPPARGGGKSHRFYASMANDVSDREIQLTIQGQTVSSGFGTIEAARFNMEQLVHAGLVNTLYDKRKETLSPVQAELMDMMAVCSFEKYSSLKAHPSFIDYLSAVSPLLYYAETNIGSRPSKRGKSLKISLNDLRAIPYVGAWSQVKQNVTGFYGVGTALQNAEKDGRWTEIKKLYDDSLFFKTLVDNCAMALKKSFLPLTAYLEKDAEFKDIWKNISKEYHLSVQYLLKLSGEKSLMDGYPVDQLSISMRERIVLPLLTIQQYALSVIRSRGGKKKDEKSVWQKLVVRCSFGIINAGRNSA